MAPVSNRHELVFVWAEVLLLGKNWWQRSGKGAQPAHIECTFVTGIEQLLSIEMSFATDAAAARFTARKSADSFCEHLMSV